VEQRGGARSPHIAQRSAPLPSWSAASRKFGRREITQRTVWPGIIVIVFSTTRSWASEGNSVSFNSSSRRRALLAGLRPQSRGTNGYRNYYVWLIYAHQCYWRMVSS
jgi:hypothetical protein